MYVSNKKKNLILLSSAFTYCVGPGQFTANYIQKVFVGRKWVGESERAENWGATLLKKKRGKNWAGHKECTQTRLSHFSTEEGRAMLAMPRPRVVCMDFNFMSNQIIVNRDKCSIAKVCNEIIKWSCK